FRSRHRRELLEILDYLFGCARRLRLGPEGRNRARADPGAVRRRRSGAPGDCLRPRFAGNGRPRFRAREDSRSRAHARLYRSARGRARGVPAMSRASLVAHRLVAGFLFHRYFDAVYAGTDALRSEVFRIRYDVYCAELGYESAARYPTMEETDEY